MTPPAQSGSIPNHHPECKTVTLRQMSEAWAEPLPPNLVARQDEFGLMDCHDDCPSRAASIERGRELAERFGW